MTPRLTVLALSASRSPPRKGSFFLIAIRGVGKRTRAREKFPDASVDDLLDEARHLTLPANPDLLANAWRDLPAGGLLVLDQVEPLPAPLNQGHRARRQRQSRMRRSS
jgi:hypothetical protein